MDCCVLLLLRAKVAYNQRCPAGWLALGTLVSDPVYVNSTRVTNNALYSMGRDDETIDVQ